MKANTMRRTLRYIIAASFLIFALTLATLFARYFSLVPQRPAPPFRTLGDKTARVHFQEFTDFACPACAYAHQQIHMIVKLYPGKIRLSFKHYPLGGIHTSSFDAAVSADCAGKQGKFWEYADILFENQDWSDFKDPSRKFVSIAGRLGLDTGLFESCVKDPSVIKGVELDMAEGIIRGINATPTFFMNRKRIVGARQLTEAAKHLDKMVE